MSAVVAPAPAPVPITMPPQLPVDPSDNRDNTNNAPGWGSYLYQNFVLPALTPNTAAVSEWLNLNTPLGYLTPRQEAAMNAAAAANANANPGGFSGVNPPADYFGSEWNKDVATLLAQQQSSQQQSLSSQMAASSSRSQSLPMSLLSQSMQQPQQSGPSSFFPQPYFYNSTTNNANNNNSIATSLLLNAAVASSSSGIQSTTPRTSQSPFVVHPSFTTVVSGETSGAHITRSPSPVTTTGDNTPHMSPKRGAKRRVASLDDEDSYSHVSDQDHEVPEGVERDGMIWGMKVEDYRALSARERKRVRNRISARTFRAKRKEHLSSLQESMNSKDLELKLANEETKRLRSELQELKNRLAKYES